MPSAGLYEKVLAALAGEKLPTPPAPRPSAATVPWRRTGGASGEVEVFWVRRAESLAFMGGWHAFPGGGLAREDAGVPIEGWPRGLELHDMVPGLLACALRELFEETGILLGVPREGPRGNGSSPHADVGAARARLLSKESTWAGIRSDLEFRLDASDLVYAGRWVTPPLGPMRFDNRFFLLEWPPERSPQPTVVAGELAEGEWIRPQDALGRWETGDVLAAPPVLHLLRVLAEDGPERGLERLLDPSEADLGDFRRIEFRPGVLLFPLAALTLPPASHTNAYLLGPAQGGEAVLIDPGSALPGEIDRLEAALGAAKTRLGRTVTAIWLTHHHPDHVGGVPALRRALGVPVYAHRASGQRLRQQGIELDGELSANQAILLAGEPPMRIEVVHTPGHTRGHLCFFHPAGAALLCGDMISGVSTIVIDPPEGDMDEYLSSLAQIRNLPAHTLLPGHGPAIRSPRRALDQCIEHRLWREGRILEAWRAGLREPRDLVAAAYEDVAAPAQPLAERQVAAHLERLARRGILSL